MSLIVRALAGVGLIAGAIGIAGALVASRPEARRAELVEVPLPVQAVRAVLEPVSRQWDGYGTARAKQESTVAAEVAGIVVERPAGIDAGRVVRAGELLLRLDEADFVHRLEAAQQAVEATRAQIEGLEVDRDRLADQLSALDDQVRLAEWELEQVRQARESGAARETEIVRFSSQLSRLRGERAALARQLELLPTRRAALSAELESLRAQEAMARRDVERTRIVSPIDGVLQTVDAQVGERVAPGQPVARVVGLGVIEVPLRLPASAGGTVRRGDVAVLESEGSDALAWRATVARIAPEVDPATRTLGVFLEIEQPVEEDAGGLLKGGLLLPGRFVSARILSHDPRRLILVPRNAVDEGVVYVASAEGGALRARPVNVGVSFFVEGAYPELDERETQWAAIGEGLSPGDLVLVTNLDELESGRLIEVTERGTPAAASPGAR